MAQAVTGPKPEKTFHLANNVIALLFVIVAVIFFGIGWYFGKHESKNSKNNNNSSAVSFINYKNTNYGFQLSYPASWESPSVNKADFNGTSDYTLVFYQKPRGNIKYSIVMTFSGGPNAMAAGAVKTILQQKKSSLAISDDSSYATIANSSKLNISSLNDVQIVNLNKIGATAATMTYQINGSTASCPQNAFATNSNGACIEKSDYDIVNQVLKSLKSI